MKVHCTISAIKISHFDCKHVLNFLVGEDCGKNYLIDSKQARERAVTQLGLRYEAQVLSLWDVM